MNYSTYGNNQNPCLVFGHGFLGNNQDFSKIIAKLSSSFFCIAVDWPGHGDSVISTPPSFEETARALCDIIKRYSRFCIFIGYSMGGRIGLYAALKYPELFQHIFLISSAFGIKKSEFTKRVKQDKTWIDAFTNLDSTTIDRWYQQPLFTTLHHNPKFNDLIAKRKKQNLNQLGLSLSGFSITKYPNIYTYLKRSITTHKSKSNPSGTSISKEETNSPNWQEANKCERKKLKSHIIFGKNPTIKIRKIITYFYGEYDLKYAFIAKSLKKLGIQTIKIKQAGHAIHLENESELYEKLKKRLEKITEVNPWT